MIIFPDLKQIFEELKNDLSAKIPELDLDKIGGVARAILQVFAGALSQLYLFMEKTYWSIWPDTADKFAIRRWFDVWGLPWNNDFDIESARRQILSMFRRAVPGSAVWFRQIIMDNFSEFVSDIQLKPRSRGPNTLDIIVSWRGRPVDPSIVRDIQNLIDEPYFHILGLDVKVKTLEEQSVSF